MLAIKSNSHTFQKSGMAKLIVSIFLVFGSICNLASAGEIAIGEKDQYGDYSIYISGPIEEGDSEKFYEIAKSVSSANVFLNSPGGLVEEGLSIAAETAIRGYNTWVVGNARCASMCSIIWMAGRQRFMGEDTVIKVHAAYETGAFDGGLSSRVSGSANANIGAFLNEVGAPFRTITYFTGARPEENLDPITPEYALWLNIDTHVVMNDGSIVSPMYRQTPRRITQQVVNYIAMANNCTDFLDISSEGYLQAAEKVMKAGHNRFDGEIFAGLIVEYLDITKEKIQDLGYPMWCLNAEKTLRVEGLDTYISGPSYNCSKAGTKTEFAVCSDPDLWAMDRVLSHIYSLYRQHTKTDVSRIFLQDQRDWLVRRDRCGSAMGCLKSLYRSRLQELGT